MESLEDVFWENSFPTTDTGGSNSFLFPTNSSFFCNKFLTNFNTSSRDYAPKLDIFKKLEKSELTTKPHSLIYTENYISHLSLLNIFNFSHFNNLASLEATSLDVYENTKLQLPTLNIFFKAIGTFKTSSSLSFSSALILNLFRANFDEST